ncbi:MAG: sigma-70 family RNA polymerase sigma factor [Planctomycetota bacterium]
MGAGSPRPSSGPSSSAARRASKRAEDPSFRGVSATSAARTPVDRERDRSPRDPRPGSARGAAGAALAASAESARAAGAAQEVAERAVRHRARFDGARGLWPWLWRIAQRVLVDQRAASARRRAREVEFAEEPAASEARVGDPRGELEQLLAQLTAREREILVRFHAREESVATIARELALPEGTVKSHLSRARRRLAELDPHKETRHEG